MIVRYSNDSSWSKGAGVFFAPVVVWVVLLSVFCTGAGWGQASTAKHAGPVAGAGTLVWKNGESVKGRLIGATGSELTWDAPLFYTEPFSIALHSLRRVQLAGRDIKPTGSCSVRMRDGSRLYGDLLSMDEGSIRIRSDRHGEVVLERDAVVSVRKLKGGRLKFAGPTSRVGWLEFGKSEAKEEDKKSIFWRESAGAALTQVGWNRSAFLELKTPDRIEIEITLRSTVRPQFMMEFGTEDGKRRLTLETWDDELVLQGREFASLRRLEEGDREVALRLFWDRATGRTAVFLASGEKLAESKMSALETTDDQARNVSSGKEGLLLHNKGPDLTLASLRVRAWDGKVPEGAEAVRPRFVMFNGEVIAGEVIGGEASALLIREAGSGVERVVAWSDVELIEFQTGSERPLRGHTAVLWFRDGAWIPGKIVGADEDGITLKTSFSAEPIHSKIGQLRRLDLHVPYPDDVPAELPFPRQDKLTIGKKNLHGELETGGKGLRWKPVGSKKAVGLASMEGMELTRAVPEDGVFPKAPALLYLASGEVVSGVLRAVDESYVRLKSDIVERDEFPVADVRAVQFAGADVNLNGFEDAAWKQVRGNADAVKVEGNQLVMQPGGSFGHPAFLQGDQLKFSFGGDRYSYAALRVRLFCNGTDLASNSTNLVFGRYSQEIVFGLEVDGNQLDSQNRLGVPSGKAVPIRVGLKDDMIEVFINNVSVRKIPVKEDMRSGVGLVLEPASLWGNDERTVQASALSVRAAPGFTAVPGVNAAAKSQALTVPRFRSDDPPEHALVAGNGDILRGVIEAATADHFSLRSGLESLRIPRDRVSAAVWLTGVPEEGVDEAGAAARGDKNKEDSGRSVHEAEFTHWLQLANGARLGIVLDRFEADLVYGDHPELGRCKVPMEAVSVIQSTALAPNAAMKAFNNWELVFAPEPVLPESGGQGSTLLGKAAEDFKVPYLEGGDLELSKEKGKVVVLDFWATWCGPCVKALPELIESLSVFDPEDVLFVGVNQAESAAQVKRFLETRGWEMTVALDAQQRVGQSFGVEGIPHTVIIGPDGKIAWVKTGYDPAGAGQAAEAVRGLLEGRGERQGASD